MHAYRCSRVSCAIFVLTALQLLSPGQARAQLTRPGAPFDLGGLAGLGPGHPDVAFDGSSWDEQPAQTYLVVAGSGSIQGRFVRTDGSFGGPPFQINSTSAHAETPAVAYNPDDETFLVVWMDSRESAAPDLWGRVVARDADGTPRFVTADTRLSNPGTAASPNVFRPGLAYSTASHEFLVAWRSLTDNQIYAHHVSRTGVPVGADVLVTPDLTTAYDQPAVSYNRYMDRYLVGYGGSGGPGDAFVEARWIQAGAGGTATGPALRVTTSPHAQFGDVVYSPAAEETLAFFIDDGADPPGIYGRRFSANGSLDGDAFSVWTTTGGFRGIAASYNAVSATFVLAAHDGTSDDAIIELQGDGTLVPDSVLFTERASSGGARIACSSNFWNRSDARWLIVRSDPATLRGEFVQTATSAIALQPFAKLSPLNGATNQSWASFHVALTWVGAAPAPPGYGVCLDTTNDDNCDFSSGGWQWVDSTRLGPVFNLRPATTYYWQVRANLADGSWVYADGDAWWSFTTQPGPFAKLAPASAAANLTSPVSLFWETVGQATGYEYCVSVIGAGCNAWQSNGLSTSATIGDLAVGTYFWQVRAILNGAPVEFDADKDFSPQWRYFTVGPPPGSIFKKLSPPNGSTLSGSDVLLQWNMPFFYSEDVCLSPANDGSCTTRMVVSGGGLLVSQLAPGTYYWQVTGHAFRSATSLTTEPADGGTWWSFTIPPPLFAKTSPAAGASGLSGAVTMTWGSVGAATHDLCISATGPACDGSLGTWRPMGGLTATELRLGGGTYYWQVRATAEGVTTDADNGVWAKFTVTPPAGGWYTFTGDGVWPVITLDPAGQRVGVGAVVSFTASATGTPEPAVRWQVSADAGVSFANIPDATRPTYAFVTTPADHGKQFRAVFANASGGATTTVASLTVRAADVTGVVGDVDGDGLPDLTVWRTVTGMWLTLPSSTGYDAAAAAGRQWGNLDTGDVPLMGDLDGDGIDDLVVWRASTGTWYWLTSSSGFNPAAGRSRPWGNQAAGDVPMLGDVDGDGARDLVVWRASTGTWYWLTSSSGFSYDVAGSRQWGSGLEGDVPKLADLDGDGRADLVIWRPATGTWFWLTSSSSYSYAAGGMTQWGNAAAGDVPLLGDVDGDRRADLVVWRASTGTWYWLTSSSGFSYDVAGSLHWGNATLGDVPLLADMDGDARADPMVWRASTGTWYWLWSTTGYDAARAGARQWGSPGHGDVLAGR